MTPQLERSQEPSPSGQVPPGALADFRVLADLQAQITAFGQFALVSGELTMTVDRALELVARMLSVRATALIRWVDEHHVEVVRSCGSLATSVQEDGTCPAGGEEFALTSEILRASEGLTVPLVIGDWRAAEQLVQPLASRLSTVRSSVLVGMTPRDRPYAVVALDTRVRALAASEIDAVVTVTHLLSAAMDRHRHEIAQAAVAAFGRFALESRSMQATFQHGVDLVTDVLDASFGFVARVVGAGRLEVLYGRGPLGEPFGGEVTLPAALVESLASTEPIVTERFALWPPSPFPAPAGTPLSSLTVPFTVGGEIFRLGATETDARRFTDSDVDFLSSIAHLLAAALKRDRFESELRATSDVLQRALLPATLPVLPGMESVARYVPAGSGEVGGDWYDVLALPHGGVGLVIGDVEGHDSAAAATMGQVRNVLRAYVAEGHPPAEVLLRVNRFVSAHIDLLVSCCYAELRPDELTVTCVTAGHPPPVVLEPQRAPRILPARSGLLLGVLPEQDYEEQTTLLAPGSRLLLYTDGLVDEVGEIGGIGFPEGEVVRVATIRADEPLDRLADELVAQPLGVPARRDDAALLAVRLTGSDGGSGGGSGTNAERIFTPSTSAIPAARRYVADLLSHWGLADLCDAAVLAVSELATNAVMHTTSSVRLTLTLLPDGVRIGVHDTNDRLPVPPVCSASAVDLDPGGRGLGIVDQIADRWGITPTPVSGGKVVWLELFRASA